VRAPFNSMTISLAAMRFEAGEPGRIDDGSAAFGLASGWRSHDPNAFALHLASLSPPFLWRDGKVIDRSVKSLFCDLLDQAHHRRL